MLLLSWFPKSILLACFLFPSLAQCSEGQRETLRREVIDMVGKSIKEQREDIHYWYPDFEDITETVLSSSAKKAYPLSSAGVLKETLTENESSLSALHTFVKKSSLTEDFSKVFQDESDIFEGQRLGEDGTKNFDFHPHRDDYLDFIDKQNSKYLDELRGQKITPVVYRYFGRNQSARSTASKSGGSIPFILLGPNVDHWKTTGQALAARGFNVIAVGPKQIDEDNEENEINDFDRRNREGPALVLQLMDALRWNKAVIVGCDSESILAVRAALELSAPPDSNRERRVVGLILCGRLKETQQILQNDNVDDIGPDTGSSFYYNRRLSTEGQRFVIDHFLEENLRCPFTIIWDGDAARSPVPSSIINTSDRFDKERVRSSRDAKSHRVVVIGGGAAPHRRQPEFVSWVLSRFVEENIAASIDLNVRRETKLLPPKVEQSLENEIDILQNRFLLDEKDWYQSNSPFVHVPWRLREMFNEESFVVLGRVAATALFYAMALKVLFYQYENLRFGMDMVSLFRQTTIGNIKRAVLKTGSCLFLYRGRSEIVDAIEAEIEATGAESETTVEIEADTEASGDIEGTEAESEVDRITSEAPLTRQKHVIDEKRKGRFKALRGLGIRLRSKRRDFTAIYGNKEPIENSEPEELKFDDAFKDHTNNPAGDDADFDSEADLDFDSEINYDDDLEDVDADFNGETEAESESAVQGQEDNDGMDSEVYPELELQLDSKPGPLDSERDPNPEEQEEVESFRNKKQTRPFFLLDHVIT